MGMMGAPVVGPVAGLMDVAGPVTRGSGVEGILAAAGRPVTVAVRTAIDGIPPIVCPISAGFLSGSPAIVRSHDAEHT
ncbi:hypothetical protein GCM10010149_44510 [Nonomuraea roseoviolacea subsp. roseoviolacea]